MALGGPWCALPRWRQATLSQCCIVVRADCRHCATVCTLLMLSEAVIRWPASYQGALLLLTPSQCATPHLDFASVAVVNSHTASNSRVFSADFAAGCGAFPPYSSSCPALLHGWLLQQLPGHGPS